MECPHANDCIYLEALGRGNKLNRLTIPGVVSFLPLDRAASKRDLNETIGQTGTNYCSNGNYTNCHVYIDRINEEFGTDEAREVYAGDLLEGIGVEV